MSSFLFLRSVLTSSCSIRFRAAWKAQGHSVEELPYTAMGGVYGSWLGVILIFLVLVAQFYVVSVCTYPHFE